MPRRSRTSAALLSTLLLLGACESRPPRDSITIFDAGMRQDAGPGCVGTARPCSDYAPATCDVVPGCSGGTCGGTPPACYEAETRSICEARGCAWENVRCSGEPLGCDAFTSPADCEANRCEWTVALNCSGTATECSLLSEADCHSTRGCNLRSEAPRDAGPELPDSGPPTPREWDSMCPFAICDLHTSEGCPPNQKCLVFEGEIACGFAGGLQEGNPCTASSDCARGLVCLDTGVRTCRRYCCAEDMGQCPADTVCRAIDSLEGVGACYPECDPIAQDCPTGSACYLSGATAVCSRAGFRRLGGSCVFSDDCVAGLGCVDLPTGRRECVQLCRPSSPSCPSGLSCRGLSSGPTYGFCG